MITFADLWASHPFAASGEREPCKTAGGTRAHDNQCAIRLGVALEGAGMSLASFNGVCCWEKGHGRRHILRAEELAAWLQTQSKLVGPSAKFKKASSTDFAGKTGIVLCRNFWGPNNQGDHIDLWDGVGTLTADGQPGMALGGADYFSRSAEVIFWDIR